ncbi:MAG: hypothetical protein MI919_27470 [Holophagales bacterium]|nr:hypothetical protein [Holophagales bacterium]
MKPRLDNRLYYFTVEDESVLGEAFPRFGDDTYAIAYKVEGTDDVFVTTAETKDAMERHDVPYNHLAEEDGIHVAIHHTELSREELGDYEDALKALALSHRSIGLLCVGVNGDKVDLSDGVEKYCYFTAPAGHTFLWRAFTSREEAEQFVGGRYEEDTIAQEWAKSLPLDSSDELVSYH